MTDEQRPGGINYPARTKMLVYVLFRHPCNGGDFKARYESPLGQLDGMLRSFEVSDNVRHYYVTFDYTQGVSTRGQLGVRGSYPKWLTDFEKVEELFHKRQPA